MVGFQSLDAAHALKGGQSLPQVALRRERRQNREDEQEQDVYRYTFHKSFLYVYLFTGSCRMGCHSFTCRRASAAVRHFPLVRLETVRRNASS